jgi:hypothetical protein
MALQHYENLLLEAWRALPRHSVDAEGWHTIPIDSESGHFFRVGMHFPAKLEAVLVGFLLEALPHKAVLPDRNGFTLTCLDPQANFVGLWIGLCRQPRGNLDMFTKMAVDILNVLDGQVGVSGTETFNTFLHRIRAWQKFMEQPHISAISLEEQTGLCGELEILNDLLDAGISPRTAVTAWTGPLGTMHDFSFSCWAIEVKSTSSEQKYIVQIDSADQLDTAVVAPLLLATCRFSLEQGGPTLSERLHRTRLRLHSDHKAVSIYESLLNCLGIDDLDTFESTETFALTEKHLFYISDRFPALTTSALPPAIQNVRYGIDISLIKQHSTTLAEFLLK